MSDFPPIEQPAKLKVAELKEELDKRGLPTSGLKKDVSPPPFVDDLLTSLVSDPSGRGSRADPAP